MTASGHESDRGGGNWSPRPPNEQGNAHADDATGSGPKTATSHAESGSGETGIDPKIETGHPKKKGGQAEPGSDPKTATGREGAQKVFVPIEIGDKIDPTG